LRITSFEAKAIKIKERLAIARLEAKNEENPISRRDAEKRREKNLLKVKTKITCFFLCGSAGSSDPKGSGRETLVFVFWVRRKAWSE
jgi:hypothetical protein